MAAIENDGRGKLKDRTFEGQDIIKERSYFLVPIPHP